MFAYLPRHPAYGRDRRMNYEDLPANLRARVDVLAGRPRVRPRGRRGSVAGGRWRCGTCCELFVSWAAVERHDRTHRRIECCLDGP